MMIVSTKMVAQFRALDVPQVKRFKALNSPAAWIALLELHTAKGIALCYKEN